MKLNCVSPTQFLWPSSAPQVSSVGTTDDGDKHNLGLKDKIKNFHPEKTDMDNYMSGIMIIFI